MMTVLLRQARMPSWWEFVMAVLNDQLLDDHWRPMVDLCSVKDKKMGEFSPTFWFVKITWWIGLNDKDKDSVEPAFEQSLATYAQALFCQLI